MPFYKIDPTQAAVSFSISDLGLRPGDYFTVTLVGDFRAWPFLDDPSGTTINGEFREFRDDVWQNSITVYDGAEYFSGSIVGQTDVISTPVRYSGNNTVVSRQDDPTLYLNSDPDNDYGLIIEPVEPDCPDLGFIKDVMTSVSSLGAQRRKVSNEIAYAEDVLERFDPGYWTATSYHIATYYKDFVDYVTPYVGMFNPVAGALIAVTTAVRDGVVAWREQGANAGGEAAWGSLLESAADTIGGSYAKTKAGYESFGTALMVLKTQAKVLHDLGSDKQTKRKEAVEAVQLLNEASDDVRDELASLRADQKNLDKALSSLKDLVDGLDCRDFESSKLKTAISEAAGGAAAMVGALPDADLPGSAPSDGTFRKALVGPMTGAGGDDMIIGAKGRDTIKGKGGDDLLLGGGGRDKLLGNRGDDALDGGQGHDKLIGGGGHDMLNGGRGRDVLKGGKGRDHLDGDSGADRLDGGRGSDRMAGGRGDDVFVFTAGKDRVTDYEAGDAILLKGSLVSRDDPGAYARDISNGIVLDFGEHELRIDGVSSVGDLLFL